MTAQRTSQQEPDEPGGAGGRGHGVVVGFDGSPASITALTWAAREAGSRGARLRVVLATDGESVGDAAALVRAAHEAGEQLTEDVAAWATSVDGAPTKGRVEIDVQPGGAVPALVEASEHADVLVVGNRGRGALIGALLGSVAFSVTAQARCPVVVVRGDAERRPGPDHPVVVGVDGSDGSRAAVSYAAAAAARSGALLLVVAAWRTPDLAAAGSAYDATYAATLTLQAQDTAQRSADAGTAQVRAEHPGVEAEARTVGDRPARALVAAAVDAGLIVVGARGHGSVRGLFLGSVSHATVHAARCPVAVVRPHGAA